MAEVEVIKASAGPVIRDRRLLGKGVQLEQKRVAAYVRVSTDGEEQLQSFQSQKEYYQEKISQNKEWVMVEIYADEAITGTRIRYTRKFAFSSMCQCGFCGANLTRRSHHQDTLHKKPVWKCRVASNKGIENCPNSKSIDEIIIENAFLEMFKLLAENFDDVLDSVLVSLEETFSSDGTAEKLKRINREIDTLSSRRKKLTDMYLDDKMEK